MGISEKESVDVSKAVTYNLDGNSIKKTKLKNEGEFTEEINKNWRLKKIVMPDVKEGSIVEYRYKITSPYIQTLPEWRFQETIPVAYSSYMTRIPEYYNYTPNFRGYHAPKITRGTQNRSISYTSAQRTGFYQSKTTYSNDKIDYIENQMTYEFTDLPAMKSEAFLNSIDNYITSVEHEIAFVKYPNSPIKSFTSTWEDVAKAIYNDDDFGSELRKTGYFEDDVNALLQGLTKPEEKIGVIFFYVQQRMNWNEKYGYRCDAGVKKAYNDRVGNAGEINLMLTAMLRHAGLDADPVLVTTRSSKIAFFPNMTAFNYVVSAVTFNGGRVLLDATSKSSLPGLLPVRALNWNGRLIRKDGNSIQVSLIPSDHSNETTMVQATLAADGAVTGTAKRKYEDYNAYIFREGHAKLSKESRLEMMENLYKGIEIGEYTLTNEKDITQPVDEQFDFTHNGLVDVIGNKLYINPMLFFMQAENPLKQEKREYPIDFVFPQKDRFIITMNLPEGYSVESAPEPVSLVMEENIGKFHYNIITQGNQVQLRAITELNYASVSQNYYSILKDFFNKMIEKQNEKIVLTRN